MIWLYFIPLLVGILILVDAYHDYPKPRKEDAALFAVVMCVPVVNLIVAFLIGLYWLYKGILSVISYFQK